MGGFPTCSEKSPSTFFSEFRRPPPPLPPKKIFLLNALKFLLNPPKISQTIAISCFAPSVVLLNQQEDARFLALHTPVQQPLWKPEPTQCNRDIQSRCGKKGAVSAQSYRCTLCFYPPPKVGVGCVVPDVNRLVLAYIMWRHSCYRTFLCFIRIDVLVSANSSCCCHTRRKSQSERTLAIVVSPCRSFSGGWLKKIPSI